MNKYKIGQLVKFEHKVLPVLGFAESEDEDGNKLVELAWNDDALSPTGYLAVPQDELEPLDD